MAEPRPTHRETTHDGIEILNSQNANSDYQMPQERTVREKSRPVTFPRKVHQPTCDSEDDEHTSDASNDYSQKENTESESAPTEKILDQSTITEEEKLSNAEFFCGKAAKTPERYMKIRNFILNAWISSKPNYVTKTSIRPGLKDCGDVNAIGRVHTYLEQIGAINVGYVAAAAKPRRPSQRRKQQSTTTTDGDFENGWTHKNYFNDEDWIQEGPRRRRVRDDTGEWVSEKDFQERGMVTRPRRMRKQRRVNYQEEDDSQAYDPFQLIPPNSHGDDHPASFRVTITESTILVMDFHSHLAHTEIIGLLGGKYYEDQALVEVTYAFPCQSISTGYQCEMDPASEIKAREEFEKRELDTIGWYHSHPIFDPHPSVRDMENQSRYQDFMARPFIGIIISPYKPDSETNVSKVQFFEADSELDPLGCYRLPYTCLTENIPSTNPPFDLLDTQFRELISEYRVHDDCVDMQSAWCKGGVSRLDHLIESLMSHLSDKSQATQEFLSQVRSLVEQEFTAGEEEEDTEFTMSEMIVDPESQFSPNILTVESKSTMQGDPLVDVKTESTTSKTLESDKSNLEEGIQASLNNPLHDNSIVSLKVEQEKS